MSQRQTVPARQSVLLLFHFLPLPSELCRFMHARVADREIELAVRADVDAVNAVIVIEAAKAGEEFLGRAIGFQVAVLILEDQDVGRLADIDSLSLAVGIGRYRDAQRSHDLFALIEDDRFIRFAVTILVDRARRCDRPRIEGWAGQSSRADS